MSTNDDSDPKNSGDPQTAGAAADSSQSRCPNIDHLSCLVVVAGVSGAGKSSVLNTLADLGFYTIDSLPIPLFPDFLRLTRESPGRYQRTALQIDVGSPQELVEGTSFISSLSDSKISHLLFIDCKTETIINRYSETRRPHPGFDPYQDTTLQDTIVREKTNLINFKELADLVIDTSAMSVHDLRREVRAFVESISKGRASPLRVNLVSFGYKFGIPLDCDLLMDVRFLANPHFVPGLREKTGLESEVSNYVLKTDAAKAFLDRYQELLSFLIPHYMREGKSYLSIGIGCTGGKHRSVTISEELRRRLSQLGVLLSIKHRDMSR